jgi:hypothetical protein
MNILHSSYLFRLWRCSQSRIIHCRYPAGAACDDVVHLDRFGRQLTFRQMPHLPLKHGVADIFGPEVLSGTTSPPAKVARNKSSRVRLLFSLATATHRRILSRGFRAFSRPHSFPSIRVEWAWRQQVTLAGSARVSILLVCPADMLSAERNSAGFKPAGHEPQAHISHIT